MTTPGDAGTTQASVPVQALIPSVRPDVEVPTQVSITIGERAFDLRLEFELGPDDPALELLQSAPTGGEAPHVLAAAVLRHLRNVAVHERGLSRIAERFSLDADSFLLLLSDLTGPAGPTPQGDASLTEQEEAVLRGAGADLAGPPPGTPEPELTTTVRYARVIAESFSIRDAADVLGVSESRVRQRLGDRSLYGVRSVNREWRLPRWQFVGDAALPGVGDVLKALPTSLHPLAVEVFMTTPTPDLDVDAEPVSPADWLSTGGDPRVVSELAQGLPFAA